MSTEALRAALEALTCAEANAHPHTMSTVAQTILRDALAQRADEPSVEMVAAYLDANRAYWQRIDSEPGKIGKWRNGTAEEATAYSLHAALTAAPAAPAYVPLSDEDLHAVYRKNYGLIDCRLVGKDLAFSRAVESLVVYRMRGERRG